ncbi:MAG: BTAD domain-containing putative transcriptional regulator [Coriobacteriia bacterium]|nr:BTAD domain-containing putative transcriptional regulator [Coriobacteriia bacterium]
MAGVEAVSRGIPNFGPVVKRKHILNAARLGCPALTVVCAPPGYGKSVLAAQLAGESRADSALWVPLYDLDMRTDEWLGRVAEALVPGAGTSSTAAEALPQFSPDVAHGDVMLRIRNGLSCHTGRVIDIVLDGANRVEELRSLQGLADLLRRCTSQASRVLITCRAIADDTRVSSPSLLWLIGHDELRFDSSEVVELIMLAGEGVIAESRALQLMDRFSGHPALTSLMARHGRIDDAVDPPQDLVWYTRRLVAECDVSTLQDAYCAALLHEGPASELNSCVEQAGFGGCDWFALQDLAPLLKAVVDVDGSPVDFRIHAVLREAILFEAARRLDSLDCASLRASALARMTHTRDYSRVAGTLWAACTGDEASEWCENHGMSLLHQCGSSTVERCLRKIPPMTLSSSARLLLLRSATMREQERRDEALMHAKLAQRIAEADADFETQARALLFEVRLAIDYADLPMAGAALNELSGPLRANLSASADCLFLAYASLLHAQSADCVESGETLNQAIMSLNALPETTHEAVWAVNCIAGVAGLLHGRWDEANLLFLKACRWSGISPLQVLQLRANGAVAHMELGSLCEAESLLRGVLADARDAGLSLLGAYALGTLAGVRWPSDSRESASLWADCQRAMRDHGDLVGESMEHILQSMLCRAAHSGEQALAHAESAMAQVQEVGESARLLRLSAEIEIAASMLALGDRWGARRVSSRAAEELQGTQANAHLLCIHMILAELDRLEGKHESATAGLQHFAEYVSTGSANWRLAMYVRAFPGLLGVLVRAFSPGNLPLRMLRLVPEEVIDTACACAAGSIGPEDRQVLLARSRGTEDPARAQTASPPTCTVRFFGGFEVTVDGHVVEDSHWRKRKVRLLFAMLAAGRGQELPRDVILERLWPGMEEDRARRNFYVTWSAMKRALSSESSADITGRYALCSSGVCRVTRAVRSDLDAFCEAIEVLRAANAREDITGVLVAARRLVGVYTGDFLPGDVYEEWFTDVREQAKHEFCDAMLVAAEGAEATGNTSEALAFLRKAGVVDPWREDIYQRTMRCQIGAGQRSRAIETYMACRGRLVDDLGIDPSTETTRLYEAVLAMDSETREIAPGV